MRRLLAIVALSMACAVGPRPVLTPHTEPIPHLGINLGPERFTPVYLEYLASIQRPLTLRVGVHSGVQAAAVLSEVAPYPDLTVLLLVEQPDLGLVADLLAVKDAPQLAGVELCNECDLQGLTPWQFGDFISRGSQILRQGGYEGLILIGAVYTVDHHEPQDFLTYVRPALVACPDCVLALHWYGDTSDEWLARVQEIQRPIAVTEFGMPSRTPAEDDAQRIYLQEKLRAFTRVGARYAIVYQLVSGPSASNLDNFGLLRFNNTPKPAAFEVFQ